MKRRWKIAGISVLVTVIVAAYPVTRWLIVNPAGSAATAPTTKVATKSAKQQQTLAQKVADSIGTKVFHVTHPVNVLLIANNARHASSPLSLGTGGGQADIMIVAHIDPLAHTVTLVSIPRDTLFAMPGYSVSIPKIKTMFNIGLQETPPTNGPKLTMKAVSKLTGLPIKDYIVTDFQGFSDAINAVGGVQVNVSARLYDPAHSGVNLKPGLQTLNGKQALAYVRVRQNAAGNSYRTNDFERQQAEIKMIQTLKHKLIDSASNPVKLMKIINLWKNDVSTNIDTKTLVGMGLAMSGVDVTSIMIGSDNDSMDLASMPISGVNKSNYIEGAYYDVLDPAKIRSQLQSLGATGSSTGLPALPSPANVNVIVYGPSAVAKTLVKDGFHVTYVGGQGSSRQTITFPAGHPEMGWAVGRALGAGNEWVAPSTSGGTSVVVHA